MPINIKNFLLSKNKKSKIGDFQDLEHIDGVAISDDGEYISYGMHDDYVRFFENDDNTPEWSYYVDVNNDENYVDMSADGYYIVQGGGNADVLLFNKTNDDDENKMVPFSVSKTWP